MECIELINKLTTKKEIKKVIKHINKIRYTRDIPKISDKINRLTFDDLDKYLHKNINKYDKIHDFLKEFSFENQQLFEPQESIFRLFAIKNLLTIDLLNEAKLTFKNYGKGDVLNNDVDEPQNYMETYLKDMGDISDLTFIDEKNKNIIVITSKNYNDYSGKGKKFDLAKIKLVYKDKYIKSGYKLITIILVRNKNEVQKAISKMSFSSKDSRLLVENSILIDWDDLNKAYRKIKYGYNIPLHMNIYKHKRINKNWNFIDEDICKNINENNYQVLLKRHTELNLYIKSYSFDELKEYYNKFSNISLIQLEGDFDEKLQCLFGNKIFINKELNIKVQLNKNNVINRINKYYKINDIIIIVDNEKDSKYIYNYINSNTTLKNVKIFTIDIYKKIKKADVIINLTNINIVKLYKLLINNNNCQILIDSEFGKLIKWTGIKYNDIEKYSLINDQIVLNL